jgi:hypothetical protein
VGRVWEKAAAQLKASSKVCFRRKPPKIMKLCRFRYWGCMIIAVRSSVESMKWAFLGRLRESLGSLPVSEDMKRRSTGCTYHGTVSGVASTRVSNLIPGRLVCT